MTDPARNPLARQHRLIALCCGAFVLSMVGAAYAAVPLYSLFCKVTGYAGTTRVAERAPSRTLDRRFDISFDANINRELPWTFVPEARRVTVKAGEVKTIYYKITNTSQTETTGVAAYNVTPMETGAFFSKIQCFCFTEQKRGPGQSLELPVVFFVDPALADNKALDDVREITLSYTYYPAKRPATPVAAATPSPQNLSPAKPQL
jgi:cytochrome c oxidase assembly protein subunit 11